jgi:hypothetical protein
MKAPRSIHRSAWKVNSPNCAVSEARSQDPDNGCSSPSFHRLSDHPSVITPWLYRELAVERDLTKIV